MATTDLQVPLTADNINIMCSEGVGYAYSVLAA